MQISVADVGHLRKQLTVTFTAQEFQERQERRLAEVARQANLKGFRNGRAPAAVVRKRFGDAVHAEVLERLLGEGVQQAVREQGLKPVGDFQSERPDTSNGLRFVTTFDVRPTIALPEPSSFTIDSASTEPSEQAIADEIAALCRRAGDEQYLTAEAVIQREDDLTLQGSVHTTDGTLVREVKDFQHNLGAYPLFGKPEDDVVAIFSNKHVGESVQFTSTLPDNFQPSEHAGAQVQVTLTISAAERMIPAEVNADLFTRFGVEHEEAFRARVVDGLRRRQENLQHQKQVEQLSEQLLERVAVELPEQLLARMVDSGLQEAVARAQQREPEAKAEELRERERAQVTKDVTKFLKRSFILGQIADQYNITITQQDLQQQIMMAAWQSGRSSDEIVKWLEESGRMQQVQLEIREGKALEHFLALCTGEPAATQA